MSAVEQIEDAIRHLTPTELASLRDWFANFDAAEWDRQLESDVAAGKLEWLAQEAKDEHRAGRTTDR